MYLYSKGVSIPTVPVQQPESHPQQASLESHPQPVQFENLHEEDSHSSESDSESDSSAVSFKYPPAFKELLKHVDKFSGKSDENDFEVWLVDFNEATNDLCGKMLIGLDGFHGFWQVPQR